MRALIVPVLAVVLASAACSSNSGGPAAQPGPSDSAPAPAPQPTGPSTALCTAARTLVAGAQPTFAADATADTVKQSADDSAFYTQLLLVFSENGGSDPLSVPVAQDAQRLARDYGALETAAQNRDMDAQVAVLKNLVTDLGALDRDQVGFDQACSIPSIEHT